METTIFIPTKNAGPHFKKVLDSIYSQNNKNFEIYIIDSGSTDQTLEIIAQYPHIKLHQIPPVEFGHSQTRNLAAQISNAKFMVFLSQDAIPFNEDWLSELLSPFKRDSLVVAVFSKQIPYPDANINEEFFYKTYFDNNQKIYKKGADLQNYFFSNVSSCIKRETLLKYPFSSKIHFSEDRKFVVDVFEKGYKSFYNPNSIVIHSHNYGLIKTIRRYFDSALSLNMIFDHTIKNSYTQMKVSQIKFVTDEFFYILKKKPWLIPYSFLLNFAKVLGATLGKNYKMLPLKLVKKITSTPQYFEKITSK